MSEAAISNTDNSDTDTSDTDTASPIKLSDQYPPKYSSVEEERIDRKNRLTATFRLFGKFGFDEGVAGHVTVRDPELSDHFWVNPFGVSFKQMKVSDLILVNHDGDIVEGKHTLLNQAAFAIHSRIHKNLPHVTAAAHTHSVYGKTWSSLGRLLDPITQDSCAFYDDHVLFDDFSGVVLDVSEGDRISKALDKNKAAILQNHGLLTVGNTVDEAAWWYITMERTCQAQLLAEAAGKPKMIRPEIATLTNKQVGSPLAGWFSFKPLFDVMSEEQPSLFD
ncbi:MAG: ribulose-5-phosphate 4-epimerase/fuculose-1-phosphate aldolase [Pseudohongiellaceae bacterium]|jgi:ribulose-5-phosphate 4-epimerase/fuculose-1-phosphate aldolase